MERKAQAGMEFLVTYGWAFVLIITIIGAAMLLFAPHSTVEFKSSSNALIVVTGSIAQGGGPDSVRLLLKNATQGQMKITAVNATGDINTNAGAPARLNGAEFPGSVPSGGQIRIDNIDAEQKTSFNGTIIISYRDFVGQEKTAEIAVSGSE